MAKEEINFKEKLDQLNEIVERIESGELPLEEALANYEKGEAIIKELEEVIKTSEKKVEQIINTKGKINN